MDKNATFWDPDLLLLFDTDHWRVGDLLHFKILLGEQNLILSYQRGVSSRNGAVALVAIPYNNAKVIDLRSKIVDNISRNGTVLKKN